MEVVKNYIAYCFTQKKLVLVKIWFEYTGNGNADGPFVYTGFKPAFYYVKNELVVQVLEITGIINDNKREA